MPAPERRSSVGPPEKAILRQLGPAQQAICGGDLRLAPGFVGACGQLSADHWSHLACWCCRRSSLSVLMPGVAAALAAAAHFKECFDFDAKRQFLVGHVERVIYNRYKVTIAGSVPVQAAS